MFSYKLLVEAHACAGKADIQFAGKLLAETAGGASGGARCNVVALQDGNVCCATNCELVSEIGSNDTTADDDNICVCHQGFTTEIAKPSV